MAKLTRPSGSNTLVFSSQLVSKWMIHCILKIYHLSSIYGNIKKKNLETRNIVNKWCSELLLASQINPLRPTAIQKLLKIIDRVRLYPSCSFATALDSDINQTTGTGGHLSMWKNRCMHAAVCLLRAGQPRSAGDVVKSGQFVGEFTGDPIGLKGLKE